MKNKQRGFIVLLVLTIIAVLIIGGGVYIYENKKIETPTDKEMASTPKVQQNNNPDVIVRAYYQNIIDRLNSKVTTDLSLDLNYVTKNVINNFEALKKDYPQGIPYNPYICAQDYPDNTAGLQVKTITSTSSSATVQVEIFKDSPITVYLVNNEGWKIDKIKCFSRI